MPRSLIARGFGSVLFQLGRSIDRLPRPLFSRGGQVAIDALLAAASLWLAFQLRFDFDVPLRHREVMSLWLVLLPILRPLCLWTFRIYARIWRYFDLSDALVFSFAALPATGIMLVVRATGAPTYWSARIPFSAILVEYCVFVLFALTARGARRMLHEASRSNGKRTRTLVVGTEEGLASALRQVSLFPDIAVIGLLTSDTRLRGSQIAGFTVIDAPLALPQRLASGGVDLILIADADVDCIGKTVATAMDFGVEVRLLPSAANIVRGDVRVSTTPKPELALNLSLIPQAQAHPDVLESFRGRTVLITGAGGSIGSELSRQVSGLPISKILLLDHDENSIFEIHGELTASGKTNLVPLVADIRDRERIWSICAKYHPHILLHAAAYKHVPVMEHNCAEAVLNNVVGTRTLAKAAITFGAERFLMISSDKAVNPSSMMGATKRMAELLVQHLARQNGNGKLTRCACVRFGNVMGSRGSVIPMFLRQIASGGPLTITDAEMTRYFMTIPEAVQLVLQAATLGSTGEVYMLDMGDPVKITTLARRLIEMSGMRPGEDIEIRFVGARPGEKLHEQLWTDSAKVTPTSFPRVMRIQPPPPPSEFDKHLAALETAAMTRNDELTRKALKAMPINFTDTPVRAIRVQAPPELHVPVTLVPQTCLRPATD
jgi:FlaA1/EpsC-like NDP-sugar epimerase